MTLPGFLRATYLVPAALGTALFAWRVPVNDGPTGSFVVLLAVWLALAYGLQLLHELLVAATKKSEPPRARPSPPARVSAAGPHPATLTLDVPGQEQVRGIVALFAATGVFVSPAPEPQQLFEAVADQGLPVTQGTVLAALHEAGCHHAAFDELRHLTNLAFHASHAEQDETTLRRHITDIVRLARGALDVRGIEINLALAGGTRPAEQCSIGMVVNGVPAHARYAPAPSFLSTVLHVALARTLRDVGGVGRLAWLWGDQGVWLALLEPAALAQLRAGPGIAGAGTDGWEWVDEARPVAAGDVRTARA